MYKIFLLLLMGLSVNSLSFAQETGKSPVKKSLEFYLCGGTGNINPDAGAILDHWGEAGLTFTQNFASAPWLTIGGNLGVCTGAKGLLKDKNGDFYAKDNQGLGTDIVGAYIKARFIFSKYFYVNFHSAGRIDPGIGYSFALSANQSLYLGTAFEIQPTGKAFYYLPAYDGDPKNNGKKVLGLMKYTIAYAVALNPEWAYELKTEFRWNGGNDDSLKSVTDSFNIRLNNTITYNNPNGFGGYLQFRYNPVTIVTGVKHNIKLSGGISYSYDLSAL